MDLNSIYFNKNTRNELIICEKDKAKIKSYNKLKISFKNIVIISVFIITIILLFIYSNDTEIFKVLIGIIVIIFILLIYSLSESKYYEINKNNQI